MRLGTTRINGLRVGEVEIDLISSPAAVIRTRYALIRDDGAAIGQFNKSSNWPDELQEPLQRFIEALEAAAFSEVMVGEAGPPEEEGEPSTERTEPKQF